MDPTDTGRRVVITGLGAVSSLGADLPASLRAIAGRQSAEVQFECGTPIGRVHASFDPTPYFRVPKSLKLSDRKARFAVAAAAMAQADAGIEEGDRLLDEAAVILGVGGSDMLLDQLSKALAPDPEGRSATEIPFFAERVMSGLTPLWLLITLPNMASAHVAIQLGARGPNNTIMTDCIAGTQAIGEAYDLIRSDGAQIAICGGSDSGICSLALEGCRQARMFDSTVGTATEEARPFVAAEGAGIVILEAIETALSRRARVWAELVGYSCRAGDDGPGNLEFTIQESLRLAGWDKTDVDVLCGSQPPGAESRPRLRQDFPSARLVDLSECAGYAFAASGALDLALLLGSLRSGVRGINILLASVGFSGQAAALCVRTCPNQGEPELCR